MKRLPIINPEPLDEETRAMSAVLHHNPTGLYDMHVGRDGIVYITERGEPNNILLMCDGELWELIFKN